MKIVRNTSDQLILRFMPRLLAAMLSAFLLGSVAFGLNALFAGDGQGILWGLLLIPLILAGLMAGFIRRDEVILDRSRDLLEMRHSTFLGRRKVRHKLQNLDRAILQTNRSKGNATTYRVALILKAGMDAGTHPATPIYQSGNGAARAVETINQWLSTSVDSNQSQA
ncbi:hypothetical protein [Yoonia sp. SS1-5]|uniref:Uncharacterized protein n=1 Tax=Yoonia rhodophyticola TaxID=3137370 RepID=A0AAN0M9I9_9RHOB